jgi:tetratricopeptide (TPR) repeat protein
MKSWILGIAVFLLTATGLTAQRSALPQDQLAGTEMQRLLNLARQYSLDHLNTPPRTMPEPNGVDVISLRALAHQVNKKARKFAEKGRREYLHGRYPEALSCFQRATDIDSQAAVLQNNLGVIYYALGRDDEAQQAFQRAVQADSSAVVSYINLASVAFDNARYSLAEASARQALRVAPRSPEASVLLGFAEVAQGHWTAEARRLLTPYESRSSQVGMLLQQWPSPEELRTGSRIVIVHGAGPGAGAKVAIGSTKSNLPSR